MEDTEGSGRRRASIACQPCRMRKIRCDSTRPECSNCQRREEQCEYDPAPKRRGPDKRLGTRQRSSKPRGRSGGSEDDGPRMKLELLNPLLLPAAPQRHSPLRISTNEAVLLGPSLQYQPTPTHFVPRPYDFEQDAHPKFPPPPPTVHSAQQGWWDAFLQSYPLPQIVADLNFLFSEMASLSFVNARLLLDTLWNPTKYLTLQPAFILASMALAVLIRSSEAERGTSGRDCAAFLRDSAQNALDRAWREGVWLDVSLVEAALILVVYESSAHPDYHPSRLLQAFRVLDHALSTLGLMSFDAGQPNVCRYVSGTTPLADAPAPASSCRCIPPGSPHALPWDNPSWSAHEIRDEECRRVCWSALSLVTSFRVECWAFSRLDECDKLRMCDPASYLLMFPNELYERRRLDADGADLKNSVPALYGRGMLLTNFTANAIARGGESEEERETMVQALQEAWQETQAIQDALDAHECNLHTATAQLVGENVVNTQMMITKGLRSLQGLPATDPLFNRQQPKEWKYYPTDIIKRVAMSISYFSDPRAQQLIHRPFSVTWFHSQLAICLFLWENDRTLGDVLQVAKALAIPLDVMNALWPCQFIQTEYGQLRSRLEANCKSAGQDPPPAKSDMLPLQPVVSA
ncbi:hypothetical protein FB45DRAFT_938338 [Roridomyces roridus]|uniref:Zn(2)-C6 fungal-type domain-containing protein n=1 Tax=Roridomyces roridus TaxID=1738132 RepID=A0AAD7FE57_9AGAR|nr:hypothetical protein FB45DRAFT_938338 [Roridomyces roridus]